MGWRRRREGRGREGKEGGREKREGGKRGEREVVGDAREVQREKRGGGRVELEACTLTLAISSSSLSLDSRSLSAASLIEGCNFSLPSTSFALLSEALLSSPLTKILTKPNGFDEVPKLLFTSRQVFLHWEHLP